MRTSKADIKIKEPRYSKENHNHKDFSLENTIERFIGFLVCDNLACGEVVSVSGIVETAITPDFDDNGLYFESPYPVFSPKSMFPAPHIFEIRDTFPPLVREELKLAFQCFWVDLSISVSRLRTSIERLLDHQGVPRIGLDKKKNHRRLDLYARIKLYEDTSGDKESSDTMNALRVVGNLGTHGKSVELNDYIIAVEIYEIALLEIFEKTSEKIKEMKQRLMSLGDAN
ncbi:DUF4145 domain-containing protein [Jiella sp. M17.18]|uniref:DUF4145 domain-containing protein n=1 Tax=Jiella sp. M17.18 TaxID=3234247 RepID=UPI0034DFD599